MPASRPLAGSERRAEPQGSQTRTADQVIRLSLLRLCAIAVEVAANGKQPKNQSASPGLESVGADASKGYANGLPPG
jgi:hypothetical protein